MTETSKRLLQQYQIKKYNEMKINLNETITINQSASEMMTLQVVQQSGFTHQLWNVVLDSLQSRIGAVVI